MDERELKVKTTFERFIQVTLIRLKKLYDITFDEIPEVELVIKKYNVFDSKDTFEVYINTFNSEGSINEKFESILRETCRFVQLHNEYTYQLFLNTILCDPTQFHGDDLCYHLLHRLYQRRHF